jgi:hypothetical protein
MLELMMMITTKTTMPVRRTTFALRPIMTLMMQMTTT